MNFGPICIAFAFSILAAARLSGAEDVLIADFEGSNYGAWKVTGTALGSAPAAGTLPGQMSVSGFAGKRLVNSFAGGDRSTGTLTSPAFKLERRYISFLIGGGGFSNETCMNLVVAGKVVRTATGPNIHPGGSEDLAPAAWEVSEFTGRDAVIEIVDRAKGGWGHINVDQIVQTDRKPPMEQRDVTREIRVTRRYLHFPVKNGAARKKVEVLRTPGAPPSPVVERFFDIELADGEPDWWAFLDVSAWRGEKLTIKVDQLKDDSRALASISEDDTVRDAEKIYREPLRPQLHFSARRGWINDPNGLVFYRGEYHLFFQHNPYGWNWGNMHWGHAVSSDLTHWRELGEALYPDTMGAMFSGSAVVDWKNTSGFGKGKEPPMVLIYTAEGKASSQCLAYSTDGGKTFTKFAGNPVLKQITRGNRDPKVFWHEPTKRWVMTLYVGFDETKNGRKTTRHTICFFTSPNLKDWTKTDEINGFFECPDFFELPLDDDSRKAKWVLTAASSEYMVGAFDGKKFMPETAKLPGHRGKGFYAAQTFSDMPEFENSSHGSASTPRIQIGWLQAPSPGMPFNNCMSLPQVLKLITTPEGPRMTRHVASLKDLPAFATNPNAFHISPGEEKELTKLHDTGSSIVAEFEPGANSELKLVVNGTVVIYSAAKQEITVNGHHAPAPLRNGRQAIRVFADRTVFEVFASDGLTYVPMPVTRNEKSAHVTVSLTGAPLKSQAISAVAFRSIWTNTQR